MPTATQIRTLEHIVKAYVIDEAAEVRDFLAERPRIAGILAEAITVIPRYFGEGTIVKLLVSYDPDGEEPPYIVAYIRTTAPFMEALDTLHRMEGDWLYGYSRELREKVLFSLNPVSA